ncbi:four helix bundle protein [Sphaerospermopsis kisseleviana CS-549]|uniref:Four helix bundle protein n=1 Tax=Sphaerospermopsis kisseleviana CS-549 TaxID=3021783 RepID=A0ABT4ZRF8_9CYAN|nr:four helix bundle protein [Sphaerospermopsis kisseleviana]MDB9441995.1 four helix bundle protein [Sphaerospermopsis kisseleviana CS-549]BAZ79497.1 S23 ribosomal protein [Sphaerospermopsis kisseleviana NIES-73]
MQPARTFEDLIVWQKAHQFVLGVYQLTDVDKVRFMNIAQASLEECRYYLMLTDDLGYGNTSELMLKLQEVSRLLDSYAKAILKNSKLLHS